jgi:tRNA wybutosine-synthesizing protein 4
VGGGSDVLPWQCLTRYPDACGSVKFVDVDFPDLIERKRQTVVGTPELLGMFTGVKDAAGLVKPVVFESEQYVQIGCDLRDLGTLQKGLAAAVGDLGECEFIFVAEVSITYMGREGADEVIRWASTVGDGACFLDGETLIDAAMLTYLQAEFVLLEQILPDGEDHPFASTMLSHFGKLNTHLKSVSTYPTVTHQHNRFSSRGWESVKVRTLWQAWADETFLSPSERRALDEIEQFDEWEEFALFASHYCVVHARVGSNSTAVPAPAVPSGPGIPVQPAGLQFDECPGVRGQRRFAAAMRLSGDGAQPSVLNVLGLGTKSRLQSCDVFSRGDSGTEGSISFQEGGPTTRMCHSLTGLGRNGVLLAGGRGSPSSPLKDCWVFDKKLTTWKQTHDLPTPLYRHAVTALGESGLALLVGGRGEAEAFDGCLLYHPDSGWVDCEVIGDKPAAVYGAVLSCRNAGTTGVFSGIYVGGLENGLVSDQILSWEADVLDNKVYFCSLTCPLLS